MLERDGPPDEDGGAGGFVTLAVFRRLREDFEALRTGLMGSPIYGGGIIPELRRQIADSASAAQEKREAALWRGWRGWVLGSLGFIVVSLIIAALTLWINSSACHLAGKC